MANQLLNHREATRYQGLVALLPGLEMNGKIKKNTRIYLEISLIKNLTMHPSVFKRG